MSKAFEMLEIGITEKGEPFSIPRYHTLIAGTTGTGKTEASRKIVAVLRKQIPDLKVLIFDVKSTGRDWQGYGVDVPIYVETATDSRFLRDLIETQEGRKIDWFFYELHIACSGAQTWHEVLLNLRRRYRRYKDKNQMKEEKLGTLIIYMEALISELDKGDISPTLDLSNPITIVPLNYREDAFKQLVIYSYLSAMKRQRIRKVLIVCDEMSTLAPSKTGTGCRRIIEQFLFKQGRAAEIFGLAIDQEITGISPSVRRQCWNWILGMQTDTTAQERTVKEIPGKTLTIDDIATLGVGWWWSVIRTPSSTSIHKFYLIPEGESIDIGQKILSGEMKIESVMSLLESRRQKEIETAATLPSPHVKETPTITVTMEKEDEDELVWKEKFEELESNFKKNQEKLGETELKLSESEKANAALLEELNTRRAKYDKYERLEAALQELLPVQQIPASVGQNNEQRTSLTLTKEDLVATVQHEERHVEKSTKTQDGKVLFVALTHFKDVEFAESDLAKLLPDYGWKISHSSLAPLLSTVLPKQGLIVRLGGRPCKYRLPSFVNVNVEKV